MEKKYLWLIFVCLSGLSNLTAQTFNSQEVAKLKSFLSQTSAEAGKKNYEQLGITDLESVDWKKVSGLKWNENGRVESLLWNKKNLAGDLDVSGFTDLLVMHCEDNKLQSMNVTGNTKMVHNDCFKNELKTVDISTNVNLLHFCCRYNQLTELDVTHNPKLSFLCSSGNQFEKIDLSKNPELVEFYAANGKLKSIDLSHNPKLKKVALRTNQLSSLDVSNLTELEWLTCYDNNLTTLKVTGCKSLKWLSFYDNKVTSIDLSSCVALETLPCYNNPMTTLDVSSCPKIKFISVMNNGMETLKLPVYPSDKLDIMCEKNRFVFSTLPNVSLLHSYAPQETVSLSAPSNNVDLRSEYKVNGIASAFVWKEGNTSVTPISDKEGLFSFPDSYAGKVLTCTVTNTGYPQLTMNYKVTLTAPTAVMPVESGVSVRVDGNQLYLSTDRPMTARIYTLMGTIARELMLSEGETYVTLSSGIYILSFDNGVVRKVYIKK